METRSAHIILIEKPDGRRGRGRSVIHKDNFIYLLILGLFNDVIILDCIALNCKMISEH